MSGDRRLLALGTVEGIEILTARQFLVRLAAAGVGAPRNPGLIHAHTSAAMRVGTDAPIDHSGGAMTRLKAPLRPVGASRP